MFFPCLPVQVIQDKVKKNYNMDMWIRQCDRGILSCYIAQVTVISDLRNIVIKHGLIRRDSMIFKNPCSEVVLETFSRTTKNVRHSNRWRALLESIHRKWVVYLLSFKAVTIVEGKKSVDVKVELCYCNEELCNVDLSAGPGLNTGPILTLLNILVLTLVMKWEKRQMVLYLLFSFKGFKHSGNHLTLIKHEI